MWIASKILKNSVILSTGECIFGESKETGIYISPQALLIKGKAVYHAENANLEDVDWTMRQGNIAGDLQVKGASVLSGLLKACHGVELGINGNTCLSIDADKINVRHFLSFASGYGIKIENIPVLVRVNEEDIQLGAAGGDLLIGNEKTNKIRLQAGIADIDGDYVLLSQYGAAYFPDSLRVRHNYGDDLLSSYRVNSSDEGITIHKRLRFGTSKSAFLSGVEGGICFSSFVEHITPGERTVLAYDTLIKYLPSTSRYKPLNRLSDTFFITTQADFVLFEKSVETKGHIGIDNSFTRITDGCLFFTNVSATFDELTVRKKMRIYELEVQKISAANGSLWVSDSCQGDRVEKL